MNHLIAISYTDETRAGRAAEEVGRCADEMLLGPDATATLICDRVGGVQLMTRRGPGASPRWSRFWAALADAVLDADAGVGDLDREFRRRLRRALRPGTSALLVATPDSRRGLVLDALSPLDGTVVDCALPASPYDLRPERETGDLRRTDLAGERTMLAWWRTGLASLAVALGVGRLLPELSPREPSWPYAVLGLGFALFAAGLIFYGTRRRGVEGQTSAGLILATAFGLLLTSGTMILIAVQ